LLVLLLLSLEGCSSFNKIFNFTSIDEEGKETKADLDRPAKDLLVQGMEDYNVGKYFTAIEAFQEILNRYPFSPEAPLAELKAADCNFYLEKYAEAIVLYDEFINRHPTNESIAYVIYQKGMCHYKQLDRVDRDITPATRAMDQFKQLLKVYPNSPYSGDAKARIAEVTDFLADHEYLVADFYLRTGKNDQAKVRLKYLLAKYPNQRISPQAKAVLSQLEKNELSASSFWSWLPKFTFRDSSPPVNSDKGAAGSVLD
jgi:outer membrane protein assembly factor BamD